MISIDYAFRLPEESEDGVAPILIAFDHTSGAIWTLEVDKKGVESSIGVDWLASRLDMAGYAGVKITIRSDQEPSIKAVKNAVAIKRAAVTAMIESPVRESKSNGRIERAVRTWRDQFRTLKHYYERRTKSKMENGSAISTWLISWAAEVLNKFKIQECGRTAFERLTSHRCTHAIIGFGEVVDFQHSASTKDDYKKDTGIFVGMDDRCNTFLIATQEGVYGSSGIMRLPEDQEYDASRAMDVKVKYADYLRSGVLAPPSGVPSRGEVIGGNADPQPVPNAGGAYVPRRTRITKADLEAHGYTPGCPG